MGLSMEVKRITPALAEEWLKLNMRNRTVSRRTVEQYARDMAAGRWKLTGEGLKFDTNMHLSDGQHRLRAVILANIEVDMLVIWGIEPDVQEVLDTGRKRSGGDALSLNGYHDTHRLAATTRLAIAWNEGAITSAVQQTIRIVSNLEILEFVRDNPDLDHAVKLANSHRTIQVPGSALALCIWLTRRIDEQASDEFFAILDDYRTQGKGDPIFTLAKRLSIIAKGNEELSRIGMSYLIIRTWNAHRKHEPLHTLRLGGAAAIPFPRPI